jgi:hypothetical protein
MIDHAQNNHSLSSKQLTDCMHFLSQSNQDLEKPESFIGYRIASYKIKYTEYQPDKITDIITFKHIDAN